MNKIVTVADLIAILQRCDPAMPVATHANNHDYLSGLDSGAVGALRVGLLHTYGGDHVIIGNVSKLDLNGKNWHVAEMLDGGRPVPRDWGVGDTRSRSIYLGARSDHECDRCSTLDFDRPDTTPLATLLRDLERGDFRSQP